jgi:hypothetical protein
MLMVVRYYVASQQTPAKGVTEARVGMMRATEYLDCGGVFALPPLLVIARETIESGGHAKTPPQSKYAVACSCCSRPKQD